MGHAAADCTSKCKARVEINSCRTRRRNTADSPDFRLHGRVDGEGVEDIRLVEHFGVDSSRERSGLSCFYSGLPAAEMERDGEEVKECFCAGGEITADQVKTAQTNRPPARRLCQRGVGALCPAWCSRKTMREYRASASPTGTRMSYLTTYFQMGSS